MRRIEGLVAGLLAGAVSTGLHAQDADAPADPVQSPPVRTVPEQGPGPAPVPDAAVAAPGGPAAPPRIEFKGADGKPLPPEVQRRLEERFRNDPTLLQRSRAAPPDAGQGDIVVSGQRPRGSVIGDIPPERTFSPIDIRAYGASDIGELIEALGPQVSSDRGREDSGPIVLLNGKRVSSFAEIARIPPEAIERMEVFPEELALRYGYRADQKVVNVIAFATFDSQVGQPSYAAPTEGGRDTVGVNAGYLRIRDDTRFNFNADYGRSGALLESERDIVQVAGAPDQGRFRTLLPATERIAVNGTVSGNVLADISSTLNARFEANDSKSLLGLGPDGPLTREADTRTAHLGTALGGAMGQWLWSFTGNYDRTSTHSLTDSILVPGARDEARSVLSLANGEVTLTGSVLTLPTGPVSASVRGGVDMRDLDSESSRGGAEQRTVLSRDRGTVQASLDVPIANGRGALAWLGDLSINANAEIEELSDFGTLRTIGYGLGWSPIERIRLTASATHEEGAPTLEQLGGPLIVTPNVRTFDFTRREVVDITRVFGGNPGLRSDDRHVFQLGLNVAPLARTDLTVSVDYTVTRTDDPIATFPIATPEIEAAFGERFTRDADGRLLAIDSRPLNFARADETKLRWGVDFARRLGALPPGISAGNMRFSGPMSEADLKRRYPGATIVKVEAGSPEANRFSSLSSRLILSLYHTWRLENDILVRDGGPVLDLLDGSAIGSRGGSPRHEIEFQAGAFQRGLGARVTANWQSGTTVRGVPAGASDTAGDLRFGDQATVNVNLFANLADRLGGPGAPGWIKGMRVSLGITNLFNSRPDVRDTAGLTPLNYQSAYLDPLGRSAILSVRKVF